MVQLVWFVSPGRRASTFMHTVPPPLGEDIYNCSIPLKNLPSTAYYGSLPPLALLGWVGIIQPLLPRVTMCAPGQNLGLNARPVLSRLSLVRLHPRSFLPLSSIGIYLHSVIPCLASYLHILSTYIYTYIHIHILSTLQQQCKAVRAPNSALHLFKHCSTPQDPAIPRLRTPISCLFTLTG